MAAIVPQLLRHLSRRQNSSLRSPQRRWARVHDVRFVTTNHHQKRVVDRYKEKLEQKTKQKGLSDITELKEAYKAEIEKLRKAAAVPGATAPLHSSRSTTATDSEAQPSGSASVWPRAPPPPPQPLDQITPSSPNYKPPGVKTLSSFLDISKILELPPRDIEGLWRLRHLDKKGSLCASIPAKTYNAIAETARKYPQFILPGLPREVLVDKSDEAQPEEGTNREGAVIHFLQWTFPTPDTATVMFTHLAEYKLRGEFSQPHTTITHHLELAGPKDLVLCQGNVIEGRGVSVEEGRWLVMCLQKFYNTQNIEDVASSHTMSNMEKELNTRRRQLMEKFSNGDITFSVQELLEETDRLG